MHRLRTVGWPVVLLGLGLVLLSCPRAGAARRDDEGFFPDSERSEFAADADADIYAGPAPLAVRFSARTINISGHATYRWNFDDRGSESAEQHPRHTFDRPGWYSVTMDASDEAGHTYRMNLLLHAWRPRDWARLQKMQDLRIVQIHA